MSGRTWQGRRVNRRKVQRACLSFPSFSVSLPSHRALASLNRHHHVTRGLEMNARSPAIQQRSHLGDRTFPKCSDLASVCKKSRHLHQEEITKRAIAWTAGMKDVRFMTRRGRSSWVMIRKSADLSFATSLFPERRLPQSLGDTVRHCTSDQCPQERMGATVPVARHPSSQFTGNDHGIGAGSSGG